MCIRYFDATGDATATKATNRRVLVLDRCTDAGDSLAMLLSLSGYSAATAYCVAVACQAAEKFSPHVILAEPWQTGQEMAELVCRLQARAPTAHLMAVTTLTSDGDFRRSKQAGFERHFGKPIDLDLLFEALAAACFHGGR